MIAFIYQNTKNESDGEFIAEIFREHKELMYHIASQYMKKQDEKEDIVQSALLRLIEHIEELRNKEPWYRAGYIVAVVKNVSLNVLKHERVIEQHEKPLDEFSPLEVPLDEILIQREERAWLKQIIRQMPEQEQILLGGRYILNRTDEELAQKLNCKPSSVRMLMTRARRHLVQYVNENEQEYLNGSIR